MTDADESKNESILRSGLSRKRSYQNIRESISGSLKKIGKKPKLDASIDGSKSSNNAFKYGNYNRYYGYRNENKQEDKRLTVLKKEWFENKSVLDVGSNVGHVSLWIGKNFHPEKVKGVDIDCELVKASRKNIVHYIDENYVSSLEQSFSNNDDVSDENVISETKKSISDEKPSVDDSENLPPAKEVSQDMEKYSTENSPPINDEDNVEEKTTETIEGQSEPNEVIASDEKCEGKVLSTVEKKNEESEKITCEEKVLPTVEEKNEECENSEKNKEEKEYLKKKEAGKVLMERLDRNKIAKKENVFPYNVTFILENYVPAGSQILQYIKEEHHVILCLSVTKWVQLNFGDFGLKLMFKKMYKQLYPGGKLILEPQPYKSYKRRKNLTPEIRRHYDSMKLMPDQFIEYLLSNEVGFSKSEQIDITPHEKQGFQRPIYVLTKE